MGRGGGLPKPEWAKDYPILSVISGLAIYPFYIASFFVYAPFALAYCIIGGITSECVKLFKNILRRLQ